MDTAGDFSQERGNRAVQGKEYGGVGGGPWREEMPRNRPQKPPGSERAQDFPFTQLPLQR